jgi:P-type Ca2+ transporter type 2C
MRYYLKNVAAVLDELQTSSEEGLSEGEASKRMQQYGPNAIAEKKRTSDWIIFLNQFKSFIIYVLIAATLISALLGEWIETIVILIILILNAFLGYLQESRAGKSIEALKKLASLRALVVREGNEKELDAQLLVPGDIIILNTGQKIPADARIVEAINLKVLESELTGESVPVTKTSELLKGELELGDMTNMIFSGTIITEGRGRAVITGTGMQSEIGKIAHLIQESTEEITPLQLKLKNMGKWIGYAVLVICTIVFVTGVLENGDLLEMFKASVSLAVAAIPEGLPAVVTITLALGVQRMVKRNALIRKLPSVETLGCTTVICTDKTGTLTHNQMTVRKIFASGKEISVEGSGYRPEGSFSDEVDTLLLEIGILCNDASLVEEKDEWHISGDPTEGCLLTLARKKGINELELREKYPRLDEIMFDSERKRMTTVHQRDTKRYAYVKGAPDVILGLCTYIHINGKIRKLTIFDKKQILKKNEEFGNEALRVLGFAYKQLQQKSSRDDYETELIFVGLAGMIDPPREEVKEAIQRCKTAGIKIVMITGDFVGTATAIAKELGIEGRAVTGYELNALDLDAEVESIGVYARVNPEDKMKIVMALKKKGHIVAMTGDGVNDAPALKKADIGISMGISGTDVAKEASSMILTDDNFRSIVNAVEEGRTIYDNITKFVGFLLACNLGEVFVLFFAMLLTGILGWFTVVQDGVSTIVLPLTALQILWMNLVTDGLPALALGLDPANKNVMQRKPRDPKSNIITLGLSLNIVLIAILITIATLYLFKMYLVQDVAIAHTMALTALVILQVVVVVEIIRNKYHTFVFSNKWLTFAVLGSLLLHLLVVYSPLNALFKLAPLSIVEWAYIAMVCASVFVAYFVLEILINLFLPKEHRL